ncbi:acyl-coenzyme A synthetase/AMP-(fatty) acid ligase [Streptomyces olivoverticillatus]|uniref:Acyl-coenzyme A synthetase/AMP-(Fatty) acid ligase n=1 Tax=Streptomyces olivoverticillatus TaxID=66427 RepID=A0A7W7PMM8_9ACTN|nr:class I adenylate-forming enzyme family protein [Streptomyces olivoverticillatus]MBB4895534.1 acyl-coenzyme A synthetase/AMP-(fatty) acid ligase [Streptomyces olivoverticillatus]
MLRPPTGKEGLYLGVVPERAAADHPDVTVVLDHDLAALPGTGRSLTYARLAEHVDDIAARLWAVGVRPSEHVAVHKSAGFDIYLLACAAARIGAVPVLLSPALDGETVTALLRRLHRPHLLTDEEKLSGPLAGFPTAEVADRVVTTGPARPGAVALSELAGAPRREPVFLHPDHPALMTHTSGTTGLPKLVVHTAASLDGRCRPQARLASLIRTRETYAAHLSYVHSRMYLALATMLPKGMPVVILDDPDPDNVADVFAATRPGFVETHPNSFMQWEGLADDPREPLAGVKYFSATFDALHPPTLRKLLLASRRTLPLFFQFYGQSECGPLAGRWYTRRTVHKADSRCLGFAIPGATRFRLVSRNGRRPSKANPGLIEARTAGRAVTYFAERERYEKELHGTWWRTGDVGYRTAFGCLHLLDREVDVIRGVCSTLEVEDVLMERLPELIEIVLVPGEREEPVPVVCTRDDRPLDPARWATAAACYPQLAAPVQMSLADVPRTATMKVRRIELARRLAGTAEPEQAR